MAQQKSTTLLQAFAGYIFLLFLLGLPALSLYLDFAVFGFGIPEESITEFFQTFLLAATALTFLVVAIQRPLERGFAILGIGLFVAILIREQNNFMPSGYWEVLVLVTMVVSIYFAKRLGRGRTLETMRLYLLSRPGAIMAVALGLLLSYAQFIGMGEVWQAILGSDYERVVKRVTEEANELMAYLIMFYAAQSYRRNILAE